MKKLFTLLAVVLLTSASTMAQSGNNGTLKGDVNSDGSVDVADIVAVIDLIQKGQEAGEAGYFYLGTTKPTATNFTTLAGAVTTYTSIDEAVGTNVSVAAGETLYMLCPTNWLKTKDVALEDGGGETVNFSNKDAATISGYTICETQAWKASSTATLKIIPSYYWYCGQPVEKGENTVEILDGVYVPTIESNFIDESEELKTEAGWRKIAQSSYTRSNPLYSPEMQGRSGVKSIYVGDFDEETGERLNNSVEHYILIPLDTNIFVQDGLGTLQTIFNTTTLNNITYNIYKFVARKCIFEIF